MHEYLRFFGIKNQQKIVRFLIYERDLLEHNFHKYKELLERFSFFEHMTLGFISNNESLILLKMSLYYSENAFGQHQGYRDFKNSLIFESNILQDPNIKDFSSLSKLLGLVVINNTDMFESLDAGRVTFNLSVSTNRGVRIIIAVLKDI